MLQQYVTITSQGQITIPAAMRRKFQMDKADKVLVRADDIGMRIEPVPDIDDLMGVFHTTKKIPFKKIRAAFEDAVALGEV